MMELEELQIDTRAGFQAAKNYQILTYYYMFQWADQNIVGIVFFYVTDQKVSNNAKTYQLEQRERERERERSFIYIKFLNI